MKHALFALGHVMLGICAAAVIVKALWLTGVIPVGATIAGTHVVLVCLWGLHAFGAAGVAYAIGMEVSK